MLPARNNAYQGFADVKYVGNIDIGYADSTHATDQENITVADFGLKRRCRKASESLGVVRVVSVGAPLKIAYNIVGLDGINVVHNRKVVGVWDKCHRNQTVNTKSRLLSALAENNSRISVAGATSWFGHLVPDYLSVALMRVSVGIDNLARQTSYATNVADFVKSFVSHHGFPFFSKVVQGYFPLVLGGTILHASKSELNMEFNRCP